MNVKLGHLLMCFLFVGALASDAIVKEDNLVTIASLLQGEYHQQGIKASWLEVAHRKIKQCQSSAMSYKDLLGCGLSSIDLDSLALEWCRHDATITLAILPRVLDESFVTGQLCKGFYVIYRKNIKLTNNLLSYISRQIRRIDPSENKIKNLSAGNWIAWLFKGPGIEGFGDATSYFYVTGDLLVPVCQVILSDITIHFANNSQSMIDGVFEKRFEIFKQLSQQNNLDLYKICINGGGSLAAYGLRDSVNDFDIMTHDFLTIQSLFKCKKAALPFDINGGWRNRDEVDDVIYNPRNHFYYDGYKFASLQKVREKKYRNRRPKDVRDLKIIDSFLAACH